MSGAVIISMLLPCIPSLVAPYLGDILEIFIQMASFIVYKPGENPINIHTFYGVYNARNDRNLLLGGICRLCKTFVAQIGFLV